MQPMIDPNLPPALYAGQLNLDLDVQDDFRFFEDRFNHAIDL